MAIVNAQTEELISQIERAFRGVERPQITLRVGRALDDNMQDELPKLRKLDDHYGGWSEIPEEDIEKFQDVFRWLCPIGFRFYLPAFMIHSLRFSKEPATDVWLSGAFSESEPGVLESTLEFLNPAQKEVVWRFLVIALESVHDDYNRDWWNHSWDKEWAEDFDKERVWANLGRAFTLLKSKVEQDRGKTSA